MAAAENGSVGEPDADSSDVDDEVEATEVGMHTVDGVNGRSGGWVVTAGDSMPVLEEDVIVAVGGAWE